MSAEPAPSVTLDDGTVISKDEGILAPNGVRYGGDKTQAFRFSGGTRF